MLTQRNARWAPLLPLMRGAWNGAGPFIGFLVCVMLKAEAALPGVSFVTLALAAVVCGVVSEVAVRLVRQSRASRSRIRTAVVGSSTAASLLEREMTLARVPDFTIIGRVDISGEYSSRLADELVLLLGSVG